MGICSGPLSLAKFNYMALLRDWYGWKFITFLFGLKDRSLNGGIRPSLSVGVNQLTPCWGPLLIIPSKSPSSKWGVERIWCELSDQSVRGCGDKSASAEGNTRLYSKKIHTANKEVLVQLPSGYECCMRSKDMVPNIPNRSVTGSITTIFQWFVHAILKYSTLHSEK